MSYEWKEIIAKLDRYAKLERTPIGIQSFEKKEHMEQIPKLRHAKHIHAPCQLLGQAMQLGFTIGFSADDIVTKETGCCGVTGLLPQTDEFWEGKIFDGIWCKNAEDAAKHHGALTRVTKKYEALVASPLTSGKIDPDVCILVGSPGRIFMLLTGYQRTEYKPISFTHIGESSCSMTWVRTLNTGEIGLSLPCFAEQRYAGFSENEVILTMTPDDLIKAVEGMEQLYKVGLRAPIARYGAQCDIREGVGVSYPTYVK